MEKKALVYTGKVKKLYQTENAAVLFVEYLDQATALNGQKKDKVLGKGALNNQITSLIFEHLQQQKIPNHFIKKVSEHEQLIQAVEMIPLEVVVRNYAAGSFSKRLAIEEGTKLVTPIIEFYYKEDRLDDPFINEDHIQFLKVATPAEIVEIKALALQINQALSQLFQRLNICLIDFKIEIGRTKANQLLLADEISPDTCRLWDLNTNEHLDKDVYRRELGEIVPVYEEVLQRLLTAN